MRAANEWPRDNRRHISGPFPELAALFIAARPRLSAASACLTGLRVPRQPLHPLPK
jgi:hypothetical protein